MRLKRELRDELDFEFFSPDGYSVDWDGDSAPIIEDDEIEFDYPLPANVPVDVVMRRQGERW